MNIRIYNQDLQFKGIIENQTSVIWRRKYFEPGDFELYVPITKDNLALIKNGNIVWMKGCNEAGVIEDIILEESDIKDEITVKGRFLTSYMNDRLIKGTVNYSGTVEQAMRQLFNGVEEIPNVELGNLMGYQDMIEFQATYKNLLQYEEKLAKSANYGFRFRPDFDRKKIIFEIYKGVNRTRSQGINNRVIFSESYNNLNNAKYRKNTQSLKTVAYVGGEGEGSERKYVTVGNASGLELKEIFVDAKDLRSDGLTMEEYEEALRTRGREVLDSNIISNSFESDTEANANFKYKENYDLGDIVTVNKKSWGIEQDLRITQIQEVYEYGGMKVVPTFGNPLPESIDWSDV